MELSHLEESGIGLVPNVEERAALEIEMRKRRVDEKLESIQYWGRVTGTNGADYIVAVGITSTMETPQRKYYYMTSKHLSLQQMPDLTEEHIKAASDAKLQVSRFTGNPSKLLGPDADAEEDEPEEETPEGEEGAEPAEDAPPKKPRRVKFSEAHRLHFTCRRIDSECGVVPRGAFAVTPTHHVVVNRSFVGISATDANNIGSYCHFRPATGAARKGALARAAVVGAGDFLDPLSEDEPKGTWSSVLALGRGSVQLRNARWPGYFFWHAFETPKFGSVYQGDGRRNEDLSWSI